MWNAGGTTYRVGTAAYCVATGAGTRSSDIAEVLRKLRSKKNITGRTYLSCGGPELLQAGGLSCGGLRLLHLEDGVYCCTKRLRE